MLAPLAFYLRAGRKFRPNWTEAGSPGSTDLLQWMAVGRKQNDEALWRRISRQMASTGEPAAIGPWLPVLDAMANRLGLSENVMAGIVTGMKDVAHGDQPLPSPWEGEVRGMRLWRENRPDLDPDWIARDDRLHARILDLERLTQRVTERIRANDIPGICEALEPYPFRDTRTARWSLKYLPDAADLRAAGHFLTPLWLLTPLALDMSMHVLMGSLKRDIPENSYHLVYPRRVGDETDPPTWRWMDLARELLDCKTQDELCRLFDTAPIDPNRDWNRDKSESTRLFRRTRGKNFRIGLDQLSNMIDRAKKRLPDKARELDRLRHLRRQLVLLENLFAEARRIAAIDLSDQGVEPFDPLWPFEDAVEVGLAMMRPGRAIG